MSYIISDNNFSRDTYPLRQTRLNFVANSVSKYADELSITGDMLSWAVSSESEFKKYDGKESVASGEKNEAFQTFQEAMDVMTKRYQILKNVLISRYSEDESKLLVYGISGQTPRTNAEITHLCDMLTGAHIKLKASGDTNVLPDDMISNFQILIDDSKEKHFLAGMMREDALKASKELKNLFESDSKKLKAIYSWVVAFWGKYDSRLISLGFVESKVKKGTRGPDAPVNLVYDSETRKASWDKVIEATSYQLVSSDADKSKTRWNKYYSGIENEAVIETKISNLKIKVRARSANGFGKWSEELRIDKN